MSAQSGRSRSANDQADGGVVSHQKPTRADFDRLLAELVKPERFYAVLRERPVPLLCGRTYGQALDQGEDPAYCIAVLRAGFGGPAPDVPCQERLDNRERQVHPDSMTTTPKIQEGLDAIARAVEQHKASERALIWLVTMTKLQGATWQQIGDVFGTTRQAAQERFGEAVKRTAETRQSVTNVLDQLGEA